MTTSTELPTPVAPSRAAGLTSAGQFTVLLGAALSIIDFFIVNVALPTIESDLRAGPATLELVVAGYGVPFAVLLVLGGRLGDAFGRRRLFMIGMALFTVTSLACGLAGTAPTLVLARVAQGASAALMVPQVLSTIQATTSGRRRSRAMGWYGAMAGISTIIGQLVGGLLVSADLGGSGWRPIFLVNVPIGVVALWLARRCVPETRAHDPHGVDVRGTVLLALTLLALLVPLMEGRALGWPVWCWLLLASAPVFGTVFLAVERRLERGGRMPLLPPSVLRMPSIRRGLLAGVPFFVGFGGFMFVVAVTLQSGLHLGPLGSGVALTPMAVGFFAVSLASDRLVARFGQRVVVAGAAVQAIGIVLNAGTVWLAWPGVSAVELAPGMLICGLGQGLAMTTLFRVVLSRVPNEIAGVGSGVLVTTQQTSLALGVATLGSLFVSLSAPDSLGMRGAFLVVLGLQAVLALVVTVAGRSLPDPRD